MDNKELQKRAIQRREFLKTAGEGLPNDLFGKPTPGGQSMMLGTRQCPDCQVGQAGPVPGKEGIWQCSVCGSTYQHSKGSPAEQMPYDSAFYGGAGFLSWPSNAAHRNTASSNKLTRKADFRGGLSQFVTDVRDAINGTTTAEIKTKIGQILSKTLVDGDLYGAVGKAYPDEIPVADVEVTSEEVK